MRHWPSMPLLTETTRYDCCSSCFPRLHMILKSWYVKLTCCRAEECFSMCLIGMRLISMCLHGMSYESTRYLQSALTFMYCGQTANNSQVGCHEKLCRVDSHTHAACWQRCCCAAAAVKQQHPPVCAALFATCVSHCGDIDSSTV